jgi:hypothetical protein
MKGGRFPLKNESILEAAFQVDRLKQTHIGVNGTYDFQM